MSCRSSGALEATTAARYMLRRRQPNGVTVGGGEALIEAGASPEKANKAAEELAGYENRLAAIETRLTLLTWMVGTLVPLNIALTAGVLWAVFGLTAKLAGGQ